MSISLYKAFVPSCLQILGSVHNLLEKAEAHCATSGVTEEAILELKMFDDMFPFNVQVNQVYAHSLRAIESLNDGVFSPYLEAAPESFEGLKALVKKSISGLEELDETSLDEHVGHPMKFKFNDYELPFSAENFLLSFSQPNFYFHAVTIYDLLRKEGVEIGKVDWMGAMRLAQ